MREHHPIYHLLQALQVGQQLIVRRTHDKLSIYVSHYGARHGRKFRVRSLEYGHRVERLS